MFPLSNPKIVYVFALLTFLCSLNVKAQQFSNARFWGSSQGLKSTGVKLIEEDKDGMIWLGTYTGLVRFDGRSFVSFDKIIPGHKIGVELIHSIAVVDHKLWISSESGLYVFDVLSYKLKLVLLPDKSGVYNPKFKVREVVKIPNNQILIGGVNGYYWLAKNENDITCKVDNLHEGKLMNPIATFAIQNNDSVWFHTDNGEVFCYSIPQEKLVYYHHLQADIHHVFYTPEKGVILKRNIQLFEFNPVTRTCKLWGTDIFKSAGYILPQDDGGFWLTRLSKELYYCNNQNEVTNLSYAFGKIEEPNYKILTIAQFKNSLWVGTNYGLLRLNVSRNKYPHIYATEPGVTDVVNTSVRGMCEIPGGDLIFACYNGLFKISQDLKNKTIIPLILDSIHDYIPYSLCYYQNKLWVGSEGGGMGEFNLKTKKLTRFVPYYYNHGHRAVYNIFVDSVRNRFILATHRGLINFDLKTRKYSNQYINEQADELNNIKVSQIAFYNNYYYLATSQGLLVCDRSFNVIKKHIFKGRQVYSLLIDKVNDEVWVGTGGDGAHVIKDNKLYKHYSTQNGLSDNKIASIVKSGDKIYLGTYGGLSIFNTHTKTFINVQADQGLSSNEFNHGASFVDSKGQIFMGGVNGYNVVNGAEKSISFNAAHQPVLSSIFVLNGKNEQAVFNVKTLKKLFIPSDNKIIEFEFGMPDYNFPEKCMFAYKLIGIDKDWVQLGNRNYLRLTELKAGNYTLMVKACSSKGVWYAMQNSLKIEVDSPFYSKWWFITMVVLVVGGSVIAFYKFRIFQLKKLLQLRLQISSDLHDEVGSILTAVGMQAELLQLKNNSKQPELLQIAETSRKAVSNMRDVIWSIDTRNDSVKDLIDRMHEYLSSLFDASSTNYNFSKNVANPDQTIDLITRQNTYLIFKEAVNNIAKHANATNVHIDLNITANHIRLEITNNGQAKPIEKRGMGLNNMEMRAQKMKAILIVDAENSYKLVLMKRF